MGRSGVGGSGDKNRRRIPGSREGTDYSQVGVCHNLPDFFCGSGSALFCEAESALADKQDPDPHQSQKCIPDLHQSQNSGAVGGGLKMEQ
jgi:hypothetical protein